MEIIFTEFIFAYLLAKCHKKVATIIFYFARAVSHAAVRTDRLCYIKSPLSPRPAINRFNLCTVPEKLTTLQAGTQKVGGKKRISGRIRTLGSKSDFRVKN
jgi:hypothetical protein